MAIGRQWREAMAEVLGIPEPMLKHIERKLGEGGMLGARGARGRSAPHFEPTHGARFLIGAVAAFADGGQVGATIARTVERLGQMPGGSGPIRVIAGTDFDGLRHYADEFGADYALKHTMKLISCKNFEEDVATILASVIDTDTREHTLSAVNSIGIESFGVNTFGIISLDGNRSLLDHGGKYIPGGDAIHTVVYALDTNTADAFERYVMNQHGLIRKASINRLALRRLGALLT